MFAIPGLPLVSLVSPVSPHRLALITQSSGVWIPGPSAIGKPVPHWQRSSSLLGRIKGLIVVRLGWQRLNGFGGRDLAVSAVQEKPHGEL